MLLPRLEPLFSEKVEALQIFEVRYFCLRAPNNFLFLLAASHGFDRQNCSDCSKVWLFFVESFWKSLFVNCVEQFCKPLAFFIALGRFHVRSVES